jgi:dihydrofolate reductase
MRPLRYSINITVDGCCDHLAGIPDETIHRHATGVILQADALLFGRTIYEMMEAAWRRLPDGTRPDWMAEWMYPFADAIDAAKKYVVSDTLKSADWNAEIIRGPDLERTVRKLKEAPGNGLYTGGVTLARTLAELDLIDEYQFLVMPRLAGHGPAPFNGLSRHLDLTLTGCEQLVSGAVVLKYEPKRPNP